MLISNQRFVAEKHNISKPMEIRVNIIERPMDTRAKSSCFKARLIWKGSSRRTCLLIPVSTATTISAKATVVMSFSSISAKALRVRTLCTSHIALARPTTTKSSNQSFLRMNLRTYSLKATKIAATAIVAAYNATSPAPLSCLQIDESEGGIFSAIPDREMEMRLVRY